MTYNDYVTALANGLVITAADPRFTALLPTIITHAELRIMREPSCDFLANRGPADNSQFTTSGSRVVPIAPSMVVIEKVNIILPANLSTPSLGTRVPLLRTSRAFIDAIWPIEQQTATPTPWQTYYTIDAQWSDLQNSIIIAPTPDNTYIAQQYGTHRPPPLSPTNQTTFLTIEYPELFFACSMAFCCGILLKNFGAQADDPRMAQSWEQTYQQLLHGIEVESMRQRYVSSGWSPYPPAPLAAIARSDRLIPVGGAPPASGG